MALAADPSTAASPRDGALVLGSIGSDPQLQVCNARARVHAPATATGHGVATAALDTSARRHHSRMG